MHSIITKEDSFKGIGVQDSKRERGNTSKVTGTLSGIKYQKHNRVYLI